LIEIALIHRAFSEIKFAPSGRFGANFGQMALAMPAERVSGRGNSLRPRIEGVGGDLRFEIKAIVPVACRRAATPAASS
jgi:hypothetical protein